MQVWRTAIAVRSLDDGGLLLFSGGTRNGNRSEAEVMADYAREVLGVQTDQVLVETKAKSTWENVSLSLPLLDQARTIKVASSPMHAAHARGFIIKQRPELASRLRKADDYRLGEQPFWKSATVAYYLGLRLHATVRQMREQGRPFRVPSRLVGRSE